MAKKTDKKTCFVVSPIGSAGSPERIHADWLLEGIIKPVFETHFSDYNVIRADKMPAPGMIDSQIIEHLLDADLVIADITTLNPNVFYEIGIRHVMRKPIVHMNLVGSPIPFDIKIFKHLSFSLTTPQDLEDAKRALKEVLDSVHEEGFKVDNPVTRTRAKVEFSETATPAERLIEQQLDDLRERMNAVERGSEENLIVPFISKKNLPRVTIGSMSRFAGGGLSYIIGDITFEVKVSSSVHKKQLGLIKKSLPTYFENYSVSDAGEIENKFFVSIRDTERNRENLNDFRADFHGEECSITILFPK
jgi:hypothetical protein